MKNYKYIDVHCHPNLDGLREQQDEVITKMAEEGVLGIVVGTNLESSQEAVALARKYDHLFATVGLHPNYAHKESFDATIYGSLLREQKVVGVGECGIDYFRLPEQAKLKAESLELEKLKEKQWEVFKQHVELALEHDKALMIHCRPSKGSMDAYEEVADYLEQTIKGPVRPLEVEQEGGKGERRVGRPMLRGNMHFFVGNVDVARRFWNLGFTTSFTGVLTFTKDYDEVVCEAPLDMLLSETDAPYATPVPHRGSVNQPVYVRHVAEAIARIRGEAPETVGQALLANAKRVFGPSFEPRIA